MPLLTMHCKDCGTTYEFLHRSISKEPEPVCEKCGSKNSDHIIGAGMPSVHYVKGVGGFYSKDNEDPRERIKYLGSNPYKESRPDDD